MNKQQKRIAKRIPAAHGPGDEPTEPTESETDFESWDLKTAVSKTGIKPSRAVKNLNRWDDMFQFMKSGKNPDSEEGRAIMEKCGGKGAKNVPEYVLNIISVIEDKRKDRAEKKEKKSLIGKAGEGFKKLIGLGKNKEKDKSEELKPADEKHVTFDEKSKIDEAKHEELVNMLHEAREELGKSHIEDSAKSGFDEVLNVTQRNVEKGKYDIEKFIEIKQEINFIVNLPEEVLKGEDAKKRFNELTDKWQKLPLDKQDAVDQVILDLKELSKELKEQLEKSKVEPPPKPDEPVKTDESVKTVEPAAPEPPKPDESVKTDKPLATTDLETTKSDGDEYIAFTQRLGEFVNNNVDPTEFTKSTVKERRHKMTEIFENYFNEHEDDFKTLHSSKTQLRDWWNSKFAGTYGIRLQARNTQISKKVRGGGLKMIDFRENYISPPPPPVEKPVKTKQMKIEKAGKAKGSPFLAPRTGGNSKRFFSYDIHEIFRIIEEELGIELSEEGKMNIEALVYSAVNNLINSHGAEHGQSKFDKVISAVEDYINLRSKADHLFAFTGQRRDQFEMILKNELKRAKNDRIDGRIKALGHIL